MNGFIHAVCNVYFTVAVRADTVYFVPLSRRVSLLERKRRALINIEPIISNL